MAGSVAAVALIVHRIGNIVSIGIAWKGKGIGLAGDRLCTQSGRLAALAHLIWYQTVEIMSRGNDIDNAELSVAADADAKIAEIALAVRIASGAAADRQIACALVQVYTVYRYAFRRDERAAAVAEPDLIAAHGYAERVR